MKTKTNHPFLSAEVKVPKDKAQDVAAIKSWLTHQQHLPKISDEFIMLFLHSNYYSLERTKDTIESYFTVRAENPECFANWDLNKLDHFYKLMEMASLPEKTKEGYQVLLYRLKDFDASKLVVSECMKAFFAFNDFRISEDGLQDGYVVVFDMNGCSLSHLAKMSTGLNFVRVFMIYIQECHPVRLKGVHLINTVSFIDRALSIIKPFMQSELIQLLHMHTSVEGLKDFFPLSILPEDYKGDAKPMAQLHEENQQLMKKFYTEWLQDSTKIVADLKKRPAKSKGVSTMQGSFRSLSID